MMAVGTAPTDHGPRENDNQTPLTDDAIFSMIKILYICEPGQFVIGIGLMRGRMSRR
jgi:hypothetical protein